MDKPGILHSLRELTKARDIPLMPLLDKDSQLSEYEPINEYILNLKNGSKPESASENLLRSVVTDILGLRLQPQLNVVSGFVDFAVMEGGTEPVLIELKALFDLYSDERLTSHPLKPASHLDQIKNYLRKHEYVILTDLRDAYKSDAKGTIKQEFVPSNEMAALMALMNSLVLNYYARNKVSAHVNIHQLYELPIPKLASKLSAKLVVAAEELLASPHDTKERAGLEALIAKEVYDLNIDDWRHLTGTFTFGSGESKGELDEIIARSYELW